MQLESTSNCTSGDRACPCCLEKIKDLVGKSGGRVTKERINIMRFICNTAGHFTAETLAATMSGAGVSISLPTIYRNLPLLLEAGIIRRTGFFEESVNQAQTYEHVFGRPHHDHLVCAQCGKRVEFNYPAIEILQEAVAAEHGFTLGGHHLELIGTCASCGAAAAGFDSRAARSD